MGRAPKPALIKGVPLILGIALALALTGEAQAAKLCCGFFPPESQVSEGTEGEQFVGIGGIAVNVDGNGPGATSGDIYVVDRGNNRIQQFHEIADEESHRFVRAFGLNVGGAGVNVCTASSSCQAGTASAAAGGLNEPKGIAVDPETGNLYVSDDGNHRIAIFSADGTFQGAFGWNVNAGAPAEELQLCTSATGCQAGSTGAGAGQFGAISQDGGSTQFRGIGYPAVVPDGAPNAGNIVVADSTNNRIDEFIPTLNVGKEVTGVAFRRGIGWGVATGTAALQQCGPGANPPTANCLAGLPGGGLGQFTTRGLTRVAVDATGAIYAVNVPNTIASCNTVTSAASRRCHVQKFNPAATAAIEFAPAQLERTGGFVGRIAATDIAVDPVSGDVYAARPDGLGATPRYQIFRFNSNGNLLDTYPAEGTLPIVERSVFGLGVDYVSGRLYLTSTTGGQLVYVLTDPPPISPGAVTGGTTSGADFSLRVLEGAVNPEGFRVLDCRFEYGTTTAYGSSTPCLSDSSEIGEGTGDVPVSAETEPLEPDTTYHYRLVAENGGPIGRGADATFTSGPAPESDCSNEARRKEQGIAALVLPDCMALEMVSPPQKGGQSAKSPAVSATGGRVRFVSVAALGNAPGVLGAGGNTYVATRGESGWDVESTVPPQPIIKLWESENRPSFTPDFSSWLQIGATALQLQQGIGQAFEGGLGGVWTPLSEPLVPQIPGGDKVVLASALQGASADHSHLYFKPGFREGTTIPSVYFADDPQLSGPGAEIHNTYLARRAPGGQLGLELLQRDRAGKNWGGDCGARLGGIGPLGLNDPAKNGERNQGAISPNGSRTYFSARASQPASGPCLEASKLRILQRLETEAGPEIGPLFYSECSRPPAEPCSGDGDDLYQGASADGSKVYFTTNRQLANSDLDGSSEECKTEKAVAGCDLYLYDRSRPAGERLIQVSAGEELGTGIHEKGKEAKVYNGITAISGDGSHVYFVAQGVLTDAQNPAGDSPQAGKPNLYLWSAESESSAFLGTLVAGDAIGGAATGQGLWGGQGTWRNNAYPVPVTGEDSDGSEVGGSGHVLFFESRAELTSQDADGERLDAYRYDAHAVPATLQCISCRPGSPDSEQVDIDSSSQSRPGGTDFAEEGRWVSEDGETAGFMTPEGLVPGDVNGDESFYLWRKGALVRLPGKFFGAAGADLTLSHDGSVVAFLTGSQLLPQDGDTSGDVYVARIGGGYPNPPSVAPCETGEAASNRCQEKKAAPLAPSATSEALKPSTPILRTPKRCPKGKARRKGRCVARHAHKKRAKKARHRNDGRRAR